MLGALDVVVTLNGTYRELQAYRQGIIKLAVFSFLGTATIISLFLLLSVNRPVRKLIAGTQLIGQGQYHHTVVMDRKDEIGLLAQTINQMSVEIGNKQAELTAQREEYQNLFERVPCYITVQDRDLRLIRYNREFAGRFEAKPGDYCYEVYKGRPDKCPSCPVERTFADGEPHVSEESGVNRDGRVSHWLVHTSPIRDEHGQISAVVEMSLDISLLKRLEEQIRQSEEKYRLIFSNIPTPVMVLDGESLDILDCNDSAASAYGYGKHELCGKSFVSLFEDERDDFHAAQIRTSETVNRARHLTKDGLAVFVNIRISPSEYLGRQAYLVTTSDITKRLQAEQQLIQASKMATLGEMATGIAHELNQPLTVIKAASNYLVRKIARREPIPNEILRTMAEEIDGYVERASRVVNHLREFGRKAGVSKEEVDVNHALVRALDMFSQQLKLHGIEVKLDLQDPLPPILADANRLEQVFVNLLINARDAIEERTEKAGKQEIPRIIRLQTISDENLVTIVVQDTGCGMPLGIRDKVFEPFFTTKQVGKGTGLGLSISYGIVQDYEGEIRFQSDPGEGTSFTLQFPISNKVAS
jgi:histidine kinase